MTGSGAGSFARALGALVALLIVGLLASMNHESQSPDKPTVLLSLDRTWWHRLGFSRFTYVRALERAGARVRVLHYSPLDPARPDAEEAADFLQGIDGLVLSGGGDVDPQLYGGAAAGALAVEPERDAFELALLQEAAARRLPILGICRGAQLLNVARGGTLSTHRSDPALAGRHARLRRHRVELEPDSRLSRLFETDRLERVVSYHGQAVDRLGEGLVIAGRAEDGVVEAVEESTRAEAPWLIGVQWHPELSPRSRQQRRLFEALVEEARALQRVD